MRRIQRTDRGKRREEEYKKVPTTRAHLSIYNPPGQGASDTGRGASPSGLFPYQNEQFCLSKKTLLFEPENNFSTTLVSRLPLNSLSSPLSGHIRARPPTSDSLLAYGKYLMSLIHALSARRLLRLYDSMCKLCTPFPHQDKELLSPACPLPCLV
ncbi:Uncharacterized protein Fot_23509 [Forsythia ovata]|uniref:Uncharacterized protein n=1 Tax=Forsythia ovata TaxID=205694 RepID=A0ABD1V0R9_9LAMI